MAKKPVERTTISVPADLRRRMAKVKDAVNWSGVACAAFEAKLAELAAKKEVRNMEDVIERLRASNLEGEAEEFQEGRVLGEEWAKLAAAASELKRLDKFVSALGRDAWQVFANESAWGDIPEAIIPGVDAKEFWECAAGEDLVDRMEGEMLRGFVTGALSVWHAVKAQL